jgi:trans-aconitate methyltransferase
MKPGLAADKAAGPSFYDAAFSKKAKYHVAPERSPYVTLWQQISKLLPAGASVLDVGCGTGQLARFLLDRVAISSYRGIDFSPVAVSMASALCPEATFDLVDIESEQLSQVERVEVCIIAETLEHVQHDVVLLERLRTLCPRSIVLFSVPSYDSPAHVRFFEGRGDVESRYRKVVDDLVVTTLRRPRMRRFWWLGSGVL